MTGTLARVSSADRSGKAIVCRVELLNSRFSGRCGHPLLWANQRDVNDDEPDEADEHQEVEGTGRLPTPEELGVGGETVHQRGRHRHAGEDGERRHDENRGEIGQLLKGVVPVEAVRFGGKRKLA